MIVVSQGSQVQYKTQPAKSAASQNSKRSPKDDAKGKQERNCPTMGGGEFKPHHHHHHRTPNLQRCALRKRQGKLRPRR